MRYLAAAIFVVVLLAFLLVNLDLILFQVIVIVASIPAIAICCGATYGLIKLMMKSGSVFSRLTSDWHPPLALGRFVAIAIPVALALLLRALVSDLGSWLEANLSTKGSDVWLALPISLIHPAAFWCSVIIVLSIGMGLWNWAGHTAVPDDGLQSGCG